MNRRYVFVVFLVALWFTSAQAQVSMTSDSFFDLVGRKMTLQIDTTATINVDAGKAGANQNWDFSSLSLQGPLVHQELKNASDTPYQATFPTSNLCLTQVTETEYGSLELYSYVNITENQIYDLGMIGTNNNTVISSEEVNELMPLPLEYDNTWTTVIRDTITIPGVGTEIVERRNSYHVDAWGSLTLDSGTYDTIRLRNDSVQKITLYLLGVPISIDSVQTVDYEWFSPQSLIVMSISGFQGEASSTMVWNADVMMLATQQTDVEDELLAQRPQGFGLENNYPNPFNPSTTIVFSLETTGPASLIVYDMMGRRVRHLVEGIRVAGQHQVVWDGRDDGGQPVASGTYVYTLRANGQTLNRTMTLTK